jgi:hypothetical protein
MTVDNSRQWAPRPRLRCFCSFLPYSPRKHWHFSFKLPENVAGISKCAHRYTRQWLGETIEGLEERLLEEAAVEAGQFGQADAAAEGAVDSGDGGGTSPPAEPHAVDIV